MSGGKIYQSVPVTLAASASFGVAFAIGHHAFYSSLNDHSTPNSQYNVFGTSYSISEQQINISAGTVLAFITKYWLSYAVSTAFQQIVWRKLRQKSSTVGTIDNILDVLSSGLLCFSPALWKRFTNAMLIAAIFWLLPIVPVITPATLSVHMKEISKSQMQSVPRVDFTSLNFAYLLGGQAQEPYSHYTGPQLAVQKAATLALTNGEIQPISPPQANSSWVLNFNAPAITCQSVNASLQQEITDNIYDKLNASYPDPGRKAQPSPCGVSYGYISWVPDLSTSDGLLPFTNSSGTYTLRSDYVGPKGDFFASMDSQYPTSYPPLSIMVAALPQMNTEFSTSDCAQEKSALNNATILECSLYNATYMSNFTYVNGDQTINTSLPLEFINNVGYIAGTQGSYPFATNNAVTESQDPAGYNTTFVEMFAYQAVMESFGKMMVGTVSNNEGDGDFSLVASDTHLMTTVFLQTNELAFLQSVDKIDTDALDWPGDSVTISSNGTMPLKDALEEAFRNITLSLIAEHTLQPNLSSPYAPGMVNMTVTTFTDVYLYSKSILWIAYGSGIFFTLLCVISGISAFIANGRRAYGTKFSTILRTTRDVPLVDRLNKRYEGAEGQIEFVQIHDEDRDGKNPLPSYLERAEILMAENKYYMIQDDIEDIELRGRPGAEDINGQR